MILSASRRTDIPCFFSEWFMNRIKARYVLTRNPYNHAQISRIPLSPKIIDCIIFWTKDAANMLPYFSELDMMGYNYYFQFTITPYDRSFEPNLRPKTEIMQTFIELSKSIGKERVVWRYDPIILNNDNNIDIAYHKNQFERLCFKLSPFTKKVIISFIDIYEKSKMPSIMPINEYEIAELSEFIGRTAKSYGLSAAACCENIDLSPYNITKSSCIDKTTIEKISGKKLDLSYDKNQREGCGCYQSVDIGVYNTCINGCVYCYANNNTISAEKRYLSHNSKGELLIGNVSDREKITDRKVKSNII